MFDAAECEAHSWLDTRERDPVRYPGRAHSFCFVRLAVRTPAHRGAC